MRSKNLGLIPLRNFACVDQAIGFYRSAQPLYAYEYRWLKEMLKIDVIINLRSELLRDDDMAKKEELEVINILVEDHHEPSIDQCYMFMDTIKSLIRRGKKFLIHCEHGRGRTSTFCVLARLAMGWSLDMAIREEESKFHYKFQHQVQLQFLLQNFSHKKIFS